MPENGVRRMMMAKGQWPDDRKYRALVRTSVERKTQNLRKFPKVLRGLAHVGSALGALVSPHEAEELAYKLSKKI